MLPFGVTIPATVQQRSEIPERLMNYPAFVLDHAGSSASTLPHIQWIPRVLSAKVKTKRKAQGAKNQTLRFCSVQFQSTEAAALTALHSICLAKHRNGVAQTMTYRTDG